MSTQLGTPADRVTARFEQDEFPQLLKSITREVADDVVVKVDWPRISAADDWTPEDCTKTYFTPLQEAFSELNSFELGQQLIRTHLREIRITRTQEVRIAFKKGVLFCGCGPAPDSSETTKKSVISLFESLQPDGSLLEKPKLEQIYKRLSAMSVQDIAQAILRNERLGWFYPWFTIALQSRHGCVYEGTVQHLNATVTPARLILSKDRANTILLDVDEIQSVSVSFAKLHNDDQDSFLHRLNILVQDGEEHFPATPFQVLRASKALESSLSEKALKIPVRFDNAFLTSTDAQFLGRLRAYFSHLERCIGNVLDTLEGYNHFSKEVKSIFVGKSDELECKMTGAELRILSREFRDARSSLKQLLEEVVALSGF